MSKRWIGADYRGVLKRLLLVAACIALPVIAWAQWTTSGNDIYSTNSGNIGIGTSTPNSKLTINGGVEAYGASVSYGTNASLVVGDRTATGIGAYYRTGGVNRLWDDTAGDVIAYTSSGNVGIGTTSPASLGTGGSPRILEISNSGAAAYGALELSAASSTTNGDPTGAVEFGTRGTAGANKRTASIQSFMTATSASNVTGDLRLYTTNAGTISEKMRIQANGNVGIGTSTPSSALDVTGDVTVSGNISAKYQDIAEWVPASHALEPGTVVIQDPTAINSVIASNESYDTRVAGVVSSSPGIILGVAGEGKVRIATTGRVKVRVDATHGSVRAGDLLVTSDKEGTAMRSEPIEIGGARLHRPGTLIGKALEPLSDGEGEILVLLSLQ